MTSFTEHEKVNVPAVLEQVGVPVLLTGKYDGGK